MRIPNLNVSESVTQRIRELDLQRLKLDQQISTGQKITLPEDDGLRMSRVIKLDAEKGKLAQYQRNASYATEFLNAGHLNLEKLREVNQRAQEVARLSGSNLNGPAIETYGYEIDELIEEALNRINATHRGKALYGGMELSPEFSVSDVVLGEMEKKTLELDGQAVGLEVLPGTRYLKQGDEVVYRLNGREYVVQAQINPAKTYDALENYKTGEVVEVATTESDRIKVDQSRFANINAVKAHLDSHDWSKDPVGSLLSSLGGGEVYTLDASQIKEVAVSLGAQSNIDFFPSYGAYFSIVEDSGELWLEPVENEIPQWDPKESYSSGDVVNWGNQTVQANGDISANQKFNESLWTSLPNASTQAYRFTSGDKISYFEALTDSTGTFPEIGSDNWKKISPFETASNVSTTKALEVLRDLINSDAYFLSDSQTVQDPASLLDPTDPSYEPTSYLGFVRGSRASSDTHDYDIDLKAQISASGVLEVTGNVGSTFIGEAEYISGYDSRSYFTNQLDALAKEKASSLFPNTDYDGLTQAEKDMVWDSVKESKQTWSLNVGQQNEEAGSKINIELTKPWKRLQPYQSGQIVDFDGKLWMSLSDENFNHLPTQESSSFWREVGSGYDAGREDWSIKNTGQETKFFFTTPDGKLFDDRQEAESHTYDILLNSASRTYTDANVLFNDIANMVREIGYPVAKFETQGSESSALVSFDASSQTYRLSALPDGQAQVGGLFARGSIKSKGDNLENSDVIQYGGTYFVVLSTSPSVDESTSAEHTDPISALIPKGEKLYDSVDKRLYLSLGADLPIDGREKIVESDISMPIQRGDYIYDRPSDSYYVATEDVSDASSVAITSSPLFSKVSAFVSEQGAEWSANRNYFKGQIVLHEGVYYECQTNGKPLVNGDIVGFDNRDDEEFLGSDGDYHRPLLSPSKEFFLDVPDALNQEYMDMQRAKGEPIFNNVWLPVAQPVEHVLSFTAENQVNAQVKIEPAGSNGIDAEVEVLTDSNGKVTGLRVDHPGKYFFPNSSSDPTTISIPESYKVAEIVLPDGQSFEAEVIWGENPNDPGPFIITGFSISEEALTARTDTPMGPRLGDSYSFASGAKTFLDHRDSNGNVIGVTYTGSKENAEFYVGKDSKISSFLNAENNNTSELADLLDSMVELRNGLRENDPTKMAQQIQNTEKDLISFENKVVDKMGELSSVMVRMETVRAHDEEYHLALDQRLANDLDVDISDAIMRLTQISTAYQAAMQVGANLLNTSLLNYL